MPAKSLHDEIVFELCAETLHACLIARAAGAAQIELCAALDVDGLTPSHALIREAVTRSGLPINLLLRPRAGDFVYSDLELALMREDLQHGKELGVRGFALGVLHPDGRVDVERTRDLVELAAPLDVTFHRAFDATPDQVEALEDVIRTGCRRLLTSGGASDVFQGTQPLARLVDLARGRIEIAVGGGLRSYGAAALVTATGARHFHGSARRQANSTGERPQLEPEDIADLVGELRAGARTSP